VNNTIYKLLKASPEAIALRTMALAWKEAIDKDGLDHSPGCSHERAAERAHRRFLEAASQFGDAARRASKRSRPAGNHERP
jgi:hypothetical protein